MLEIRERCRNIVAIENAVRKSCRSKNKSAGDFLFLNYIAYTATALITNRYLCSTQTIVQGWYAEVASVLKASSIRSFVSTQ